jgi:hypothetical protein
MKAEKITKISMLIGTTILVHLVLTPLAYTQNLETSSGKYNNPYKQYEDAYIINEVTNYEILSDQKINSILGRTLRDWGRLLKRVLDTAALPMITFTISLIYTLTYFKKTQKRKSLLAISLGGHAPPEID